MIHHTTKHLYYQDLQSILCVKRVFENSFRHKTKGAISKIATRMKDLGLITETKFYLTVNPSTLPHTSVSTW